MSRKTVMPARATLCSGSRGLAEQLPEQFLGLGLPLLSQRDRLILAHGIADITLLMEAIERVPIMTLPSCRAKLVIAPGQKEQGENCLVNLVCVIVHHHAPPPRAGQN